MPFVVLGISILLIVLWGIIDRKSIRGLGAFTKIGILTYLISLMCFGAATAITDPAINMYVTMAGSGFAIITLLAIISVITSGIAQFNISKASQTFFDGSVIALLFSALLGLISVAPTTTDVKSMLMALDVIMILVMVMVAVVALLVIVMKILFGSESDTNESSDDSIDSQN